MVTFRAQVAQQDRVVRLWLEVELIGGHGRVLKHSPRNVAFGPAPELEWPPAMSKPIALCPTTEQYPEHLNPTHRAASRGPN